MKKTPHLLPQGFPPHAPLPPGGPWIRPADEEDWDRELTMALAPLAREEDWDDDRTVMDLLPAGERDWDGELTTALAPPSEAPTLRPEPESGVRVMRESRPQQGRSGAARPMLLGIGLAPSLTPLALVEAGLVPQKRSA